MNNTAQKKYSRIIETQFGAVEINENNLFEMPNGLVGISNSNLFALQACPHQKFSNYLIIQSANYDDLTMLAMPIASQNNVYNQQKTREICEKLGIPQKDLQIVLILYVQDSGDEKVLMANAKAPLFIDSNRKLAAQVVMQDISVQNFKV